MRYFIMTVLLLTSLSAVHADSMSPREGWVVARTPYGFSELYERLKSAITANKMGHVTTASASQGAEGAGITIPGNRIVGVYNNAWARRMLAASTAAGIEAPIRFYLTENSDGTATLSYKTPTTVFAPYFAEATPDLAAMAAELDTVFAAISAQAAAE